MDETNWVEPDTISQRYLNSAVPEGLFVSMPTDTQRVLFWVVGDSPRYAVILTENGRPGEFVAWELEENASNWPGVHLGPVDLVLDQDSIVSRFDYASPGDLTLAEGKVKLTVTPDGGAGFRGGRLALPVADLAEGEAVSDRLRCLHWALCQSRDDERRVLFERQPPPANRG